MKRKDLISFVERELQDIGFTPGAWVWQPRSSQLVLIIGETLKCISLKTSMTKRDLIFQMGRLAGLAEAAGVSPKQVAKAVMNGAFKLAPGETLAGMPA
jgi:hypothetical protein